MTPDAPPTLRADARRNRERVLEAAADLFRARGLAVTMEEIAREAGVGVGTLYRRFGNRDELITQLFRTSLAEFAGTVRSAAAIPDGWAALVMLLERTLEIQAQDRGLKHLFLGQEHLKADVTEIQQLILSELATIVARAQADGTLRPDVDAIDVILVSHQVGAVMELTADSAPDAWRRALAIGLDGLRRHPDGGTPLPSGPVPIDVLMDAIEPDGPCQAH